MKKFAVYQRNPDEIVLVRENFNLIAGVFNIFWAIYNRVWPMLIIGLVIHIAGLLMFNKTFSLMISCFNFLIFSLLSDIIYSFYLEKQGFVLRDVIMASNYIMAEVKFIERDNH